MMDALSTAVTLARQAQAAGLIVTRLTPAHGCGGECFDMQLWQADGKLWAEGRHEGARDVRRHIAEWERAMITPRAAHIMPSRSRPSHGYTRHGQLCCRDVARADIMPPVLVTECGWPRVNCPDCRHDAGLFHVMASALVAPEAGHRCDSTCPPLPGARPADPSQVSSGD